MDEVALPATLYGYICEVGPKKSYLTLGRSGHDVEMEMTCLTRRIPPRWRNQGQYLWVTINRRGKVSVKYMNPTFSRKELKAAFKNAAVRAAALADVWRAA